MERTLTKILASISGLFLLFSAFSILNDRVSLGTPEPRRTPPPGVTAPPPSKAEAASDLHWPTNEERAVSDRCYEQARDACRWLDSKKDRQNCRLHNLEECTKDPASFPAKVAELARIERGHTYPRIRNDVVNVRDWPDEEADVVGHVKRGETVISVRPGDFSMAWTEVVTDDGVQGWIRNDNLDTSGGE